MPQYPTEPEQVDWRNLRNRGGREPRHRQHGGALRRPARPALSPDGRGQAGAAHRFQLHHSRRPAARVRPQDRRRDLRGADRRGRRVLAPASATWSRTRNATSCRWPTPTAATPTSSSPTTSRSSRRPGRPTATASPTSRSRRKKSVIFVHTLSRRQPPGAGQFRGLQQRPGVVARRPAARRDAVARRRRADLHDPCWTAPDSRA